MNKTLLNFIVDDALLKRIEDFRFKNRFATRAAAIKWLLDYALKQKPSIKNLELEPAAEDPTETHVPSVIPAEPVAAIPVPVAVRPKIDLPRGAVIETEAAIEPAAANPAPHIAKPDPVGVPSRASMIQTLRDQGYEVGETVLHPDGQERILVRSQDGSAWVNTSQELQDLAAARGTLAAFSKRAGR